MYTPSQLKRGLRSPNLFAREANRLYHRRLNTRVYNIDGVDVFEEDWDNLLVLDACRYDMFEANADLPGTLETRRSRGSTTVEFLQGNLDGRQLLDTVYVTANPQLYRHANEIDVEFHDVIDVWIDEGWDDEYGTVLPETTTQAVRDAAERYPNKRLVAHYIQPHYPFLTDETEFDKGYLEDDEVGEGDFWHRQLVGDLDVPRRKIWEVYVENLRRVLPYVADLLSELDGKSVVTADHGNMVGERARPVPIREWGHPRGMYTDQLVEVPWLIRECDARREIVAEENATEGEAVADEIVTERLEHLGYTDG